MSPVTQSVPGMFHLKITTTGAAFEKDLGAELARLLRVLAIRLEDGEPSGLVVDAEGKRIGTFYVGRRP